MGTAGGIKTTTVAVLLLSPTVATAVTVRVQKMPADSHLAEEDIMIG